MAPGAFTGRVLQKDEGLNVLLNIPDSAKVVAFKPEHPGLWAIKVGTLGAHQGSLGCIGDSVGISTGVQGQEQRRVQGLMGRQAEGQAGPAGVRRTEREASRRRVGKLVFCLLDTLPMCLPK